MALINVLEILIVFISFLICCYLGNKNGLPRNWPVFGMLPDTLYNLHRIHERIAEVLEQTGCNFLYIGPWFSGIKILGTVDPSNIHYIMSSNFSNYPKGSKFLKIFDILGDGIFNSDSDLWMNQRKLAQALINHRRFYRFLVKTSHDKVEKGLIPILDHIAKKGFVLDFQDLFQRFTFDVTCILVTGYDPGCLSIDFPEVRFSKAMDDAEEAIFYRHITPEWFWKLQAWLGFGQEEKLRQAHETLNFIINQYISKKKELIQEVNISEEDEEGADLLTSYMRIEADEVIGSIKKPDDKFLRDTIMNLLLAGRDTTSAALSWFFWLVSRNPHVESKIREELKEIVPFNEGGGKVRIFGTQEVKNLTYLHGALCEALRLYPPVPFQHKAPLRPDILPSGQWVGPKTEIVFSLYAMGRMKSIWGEDCLEFKPQRWISERGNIKYEPSYKFLAFNAGPRTCLGKEVAFTQMKAVAAAVIYNFHVEVVEGHPVSPKASVILHMKHGLKVKLTRTLQEPQS